MHKGLKAEYRMRRWAEALLLCLLLGLPLPVTIARASGVTVAIEGGTEQPLACELVVLVSISVVQAFDAAQFDLRYDPELLQVSGVASGKIGGTAVAIDG